MNISRHAHAASPLLNELVLLAGGVHLPPGGGASRTASAELFDPTAGVFTITDSMDVARVQHTATLLTSGLVMVAGGENALTNPIADAELFDPATGTFSSAGTMNSPRARHSATRLLNGKVLLVGGQGAALLQSAELFQPAP